MVKDFKKLGIENGEELARDKPVEAMGLNDLKKILKISWYLTVLGSGSVLWPEGLGGTLVLKHKNIFNIVNTEFMSIILEIKRSVIILLQNILCWH